MLIINNAKKEKKSTVKKDYLIKQNNNIHIVNSPESYYIYCKLLQLPSVNILVKLTNKILMALSKFYLYSS